MILIIKKNDRVVHISASSIFFMYTKAKTKLVESDITSFPDAVHDI